MILEKLDLRGKVNETFASVDGKIVDVLFSTSDGKVHFTYPLAVKAAESLEDKTIIRHYRDEVVRNLAKNSTALYVMIILTDFLKTEKYEKRRPLYSDYEKHVADMAMNPVPEDIFKFVFSKVFTGSRPVATGQKDKIYRYSKGIVEANFLRRYPQGMIWQVNDELIFTCPTHTELMSISYKTIFSQMLGA